jgi:acyl-CoA thioesterase FadM
MARVSINEPEHYLFSTELEVYISMVNRGDHLGNESLIALLNEARLRFLSTTGADTLCKDGTFFINADLAVCYKTEARHADRLTIDIGLMDIGKYGADFVYRVSRSSDGHVIAIAKTAMLLFDSTSSTLCEPASELWETLKSGSPSR